jgi:predicted Zn-dependent protease
LPQALGYQADAERALGDEAAAAQTDALIDAERTLYDARGVNDRLLALYYAQRRVHLDEAIRMARSDLRKRGDEIYADDTMAWVLAAAGQPSRAWHFAQLATRLGTQDPMLNYHAGAIAMDAGHPARARALLTAAIDGNAAFDPFYAADARRRIVWLTARGL